MHEDTLHNWVDSIAEIFYTVSPQSSMILPDTQNPNGSKRNPIKIRHSKKSRKSSTAPMTRYQDLDTIYCVDGNNSFDTSSAKRYSSVNQNDMESKKEALRSKKNAVSNSFPGFPLVGFMIICTSCLTIFAILILESIGS